MTALLTCFLSILLLASAPVTAKISSGKAHLSGANTESTLIKFPVSASSSAKIDINLTSYGMYEDEQQLRLHVYDDEDWRKVTRTPLCTDKAQMALQAIPIVFDFKGKERDDRSGKKGLVEIYTARIQTTMQNPPPPVGRFRRQKKDRPRYFYFAIDDCSLEKYDHDGKMPDMKYDISILNVRPSSSGEPIYEHLPADEDGIGLLLVLSLVFSGALALLLFYKFASTLGGEVHVAILVVMAACACNGLSSLCELIHRTIYQSNGYGNYQLDALSSYFEALSDSMVALVLLSIGGGWTLPTDVVGGGIGKEASVNKLMKGVRNPAGSLLDLISSGGGSGDRKEGIVALVIIFAHVGLAQWGRTFDDDFDTYHALEHPPGRALMMIRVVLGLVFITGVGMVRSGGKCPPSLMSFLTRFALVGLSYFVSLPAVSMFVGTALHYHQRHQALHWGAALVQASSLASLTWLFIGGADSSAYHRLSRVSKHTEGDMTADLSSSVGGGGSSRPTTWRFGRTKIRLD
ncbi:predicted protein [Thalassiosira pseudonana CCMP1335]|uniref:GPR180/TMEM145 transmembrane domain-containing protein n=1 Tax=Thalassiosira pseudonana TaxID=35128 RepID=B8BQW3_THAPS|nr:predicted protein [Thalassiosira pseudonana CCMP1335]EED95857.1 predicted protein [Thalassiosira pseudonana CCMP1335]|eukprot:g975.t1 g975   contig10:1102052-1103605(+)